MHKRVHWAGALQSYYGGSGDDSLSEYNGVTPEPATGDGYTGKDVMFGGDGDDLMEAARGADELHGGPNPSLTVSPESGEALYGDTGNDKLYGKTATITWRVSRARIS